MERGNRAFFAGCCLLLFCACTDAATTAQINRAIDRAKTWLYAQQLPDHTWEHDFSGHGDQKTGQTALAVYALLNSGENHQDPRLIDAIDYLKKTETTGVYALGMRCQVWLALRQTPEIKSAMRKDAGILLKSMQRSGKGKGFYDYNAGGDNYSHSRAQYAVLGVWAAAQSGMEIPREYWQMVEKSWTEHQDSSGGWGYYAAPNERFPITPGMTAVGVATLFITGDYLNSPTRNPAIDRGMKWMADNFSKVATDEKLPRAYPFSTLYAIERIGVASGTKYFGTIDWYDKGADYLIAEQRSDGSFERELDVKTSSTCFAILFLSRGASPLTMNKLDYSAATVPGGRKGDELRWNQRPRDVANLSRWIGRQVERDLNWQIVNLDSPIEDLLDAQILYLSGNQPIALKPEQEAKLKQFIEQGGLVLGNADLASSNFTNAFKSLGKRMFPQYEFSALPENHVIFTNEQFRRSNWKRKPVVQSIGNGVRELMILLPDSDPSRAWQAQAMVDRPEAFELAANIFLYAVDKQNLRRRGERHWTVADEKITADRTLSIARLKYAGNWDPEPGGWRRLSAILHNEQKVDLEAQPVEIEQLKDQRLAHLTGTAAIQLEPSQREAIKRFLDAGGTLLIDAAGGSMAFADSVETELAAMIPDAKDQLSTPLPADHPIYSVGEKPKTIGYRDFARVKLGILDVPQLRGVQIDGRIAVLFSREDLSTGLVGQPIDGVVGYDPATATALMAKAIRYSSSGR